MKGKGIMLLLLIGFWLSSGMDVEAKIRFGMRGFSGIGYMPGGDFNRYLKAYGKVTFNDPFTPVAIGWESGGEVQIYLTPRLTLQAGAGYIDLERMDNEGLQRMSNYTFRENFSTRITAVPVHLAVSYRITANQRLRFSIQVGAAYSFARWSNTSRKEWAYQNSPLLWDKAVENASARGFSAFGGPLVEWPLGKWISLVGELHGRFSPIHGFQGEQVLTNESDPHNADPIQGTLYMFKSFQKTYFRIGGRPIGEGVSEVREARLDFSGVALRLGFLIRL